MSSPPELPCKEAPPPALEGEGAERNYGVEVTTYRCPNGFMWETGHWPYFELECLNKKWSRKQLPSCKSEKIKLARYQCFPAIIFYSLTVDEST